MCTLTIGLGLIIDAFGELRKKDDMVKEELKVGWEERSVCEWARGEWTVSGREEDRKEWRCPFIMQNKCFVCGIGKTEFDNSQGYENHVKQHHAMKNYLWVLYVVMETDNLTDWFFSQVLPHASD